MEPFRLPARSTPNRPGRELLGPTAERVVVREVLEHGAAQVGVAHRPTVHAQVEVEVELVQAVAWAELLQAPAVEGRPERRGDDACQSVAEQVDPRRDVGAVDADRREVEPAHVQFAPDLAVEVGAEVLGGEVDPLEHAVHQRAERRSSGKGGELRHRRVVERRPERVGPVGLLDGRGRVETLVRTFVRPFVVSATDAVERRLVVRALRGDRRVRPATSTARHRPIKPGVRQLAEVRDCLATARPAAARRLAPNDSDLDYRRATGRDPLRNSMASSGSRSGNSSTS